MIELTQAINTLWVVMAGALVFLMHLGFTLLETGFTRMKNAANIAAKNMMKIAVGMLAFWATGFAFMFGDGNAFLGHAGWFLPVNNPPDAFSSLEWADISISAKWFFQVVFAATAATIVSGAMAERTRFRGYVIYVIALTAFIYPVVGHWAWGGGWLGDLGFIDFAGSTVVHTVGGTAAFVGAAVVGPRIGKYYYGRADIIPGHSMPLAIAGVIVLWFGWFGFNAGSTMAAVGVDFASIILTTNIAAAAGVVGVLVMLAAMSRKPDVGMMGNGALAGLVAITAGCAFVETTGAFTIGFIAGAIVVTSALFIDRLRVDDPVGAISVHAVCGIWGTLAVGLYATGTGLFYGHGWSQLGIQAVGVASVVAWTGLTCFVVFYAIKKTVGLRVSKAEELEGLDIAEHGVSGYTAID
jgi:Amt family ammonium transporter